MKKTILTYILTSVLFFSSCQREVMIDDADLKLIVDAAVAAAFANYPNTQEIADTAAAAAAAAVSNGLGDIDTAIKEALDAAEALTNPPIEKVGTGGVTEIIKDITWTNDKIWLMDGKIVVKEGATLTIEEGTIIKGATGTGSNATVLIIAKGGQINAVGTPERPIIFTDANDQIVYANGSTSPNRSSSDKGLWGSVIILGNGTVGAANGEANIEGVVSGYNFTKYGGSNNNDNSGIMKYVSIRHTGTAVSPGNELQGLTMGGVGSGTIIDHIELIGSEDDGIEIFGGAVDVTNLVIAYFDDDGIDLDQAYTGTISNATIFLASNSDTAFEIDGTEEPNDEIVGEYLLQNVTVYGRADATKFDTFGNWKSNATGFNDNVLFVDFPAGSTLGGIDTDTYRGAGTSRVERGLNFRDFVIVTADSKSTIVAGQVDEATATWISVRTERPSDKGADESVFTWTQFFN